MNRRQPSLILAALLCTAGAFAALQKTTHLVPMLQPSSHYADSNGAYRDGLFLGRRAAHTGTNSKVPVGRWTSAEDRKAFLAGYARGYAQPDTSR